MQQVKVPKEVMELVYEAAACKELAAQFSGSFFSFHKAIYFATKAEKARTLSGRALAAVHPETMDGDWEIDLRRGVATKKQVPEAEAKPKKPRKQRTPKAETKPAAPAANEGEQQ